MFNAASYFLYPCLANPVRLGPQLDEFHHWINGAGQPTIIHACVSFTALVENINFYFKKEMNTL